jgi:hypothetical protein
VVQWIGKEQAIEKTKKNIQTGQDGFQAFLRVGLFQPCG